MRPQHISSRGLQGLGSVREDAPNPEETGGPTEFRGLVGWGSGVEHPLGDTGSRHGMWNSQRVDQDGDKAWTIRI